MELIFVTLGCGFKKAGSVLFDIGDSWDKDYISLYLHKWVVLRLCIVFTLGNVHVFAPYIVIDTTFY